MSARIFDATRCSLGEGPLWHPGSQGLFWFDINGARLYRKIDDVLSQWQFDEHVSAAGWIDDQTLLIASETQLMQFNTDTGCSEFLCSLESDKPETRSNDGRADPWGGFWIGTMGKSAEAKAGAIYRYFRGELRKLFDKITITNAICFAPDASFACFTDTTSKIIQSVALDGATGWPKGDPKPYLDLRHKKSGPDGAVIGVDGTLWLAEWGASGVTGYASDGTKVATFRAPAHQISCPAFGGLDMTTLHATSARESLADPSPAQGQTFAWDTPFTGQTEHQVIL